MLQGPMLTERQFAGRAGMKPRQVRGHRWVLRVSSPIGLGPAYPAFQLDDDGIRLDVAFIALLLRKRMSDLDACDWLTRRHAGLAGESPLAWIIEGLPLERVVAVMPQMNAADGGSAADALRADWLRLGAEGDARGWTVRWERIERVVAVPPGV